MYFCLWIMSRGIASKNTRASGETGGIKGSENHVKFLFVFISSVRDVVVVVNQWSGGGENICCVEVERRRERKGDDGGLKC